MIPVPRGLADLSAARIIVIPPRENIAPFMATRQRYARGSVSSRHREFHQRASSSRGSFGLSRAFVLFYRRVIPIRVPRRKTSSSASIEPVRRSSSIERQGESFSVTFSTPSFYSSLLVVSLRIFSSPRDRFCHIFDSSLTRF